MNKRLGNIKYIERLYKSKKYYDVIDSSTKYLNYFNDDIYIRDLKARSYRILGFIDLAIKELEKNMSIRYNESTITCLFYTYYQNGDYKKAIDLLPHMYEIRKVETERLNVMEYYMKKQLSMECDVKIDKNKYVIKQIDNYDEVLSKMMLSNFRKAGMNSLSSEVNLTYLFDSLKKSINNSNKAPVDEPFEVHYFYIKNIGYDNLGYYNYLKVVVLPNTNNIILTYPVKDVEYAMIEYMDYDYDKLFKNNNSNKNINNSEMAKKFYKRYNIKK